MVIPLKYIKNQSDSMAFWCAVWNGVDISWKPNTQCVLAVNKLFFVIKAGHFKQWVATSNTPRPNLWTVSVLLLLLLLLWLYWPIHVISITHNHNALEKSCIHLSSRECDHKSDTFIWIIHCYCFHNISILVPYIAHIPKSSTWLKNCLVIDTRHTTEGMT